MGRCPYVPGRAGGMDAPDVLLPQAARGHALRELTSRDRAKVGGWWTSRWTWSGSPWNSRSWAPKASQTCRMTCWQRVGISSSNTPYRYVVTDARWTCRFHTTLRPRLSSGSGSHRVTPTDAILEHVSRFRLDPTPAQEVLLLEQCAHARYVWNLGLEQRLMWRRRQGPTPGHNGQAAQLTEARRANPWLAQGSQTVQQQALRDLDQAWRNFFGGTHDRPTWRKRGQGEGFRVVGAQALRIRQDNRRWSSVLVPKVGWVKVQRSRAIPNAKSYRVTRDRAGRWHIAFAAIPDPIPAPGTGEIVGVDRGVAVAAALSTGEMTSPTGLRPKEAERLLRLQRRLARAHNLSSAEVWGSGGPRGGKALVRGLGAGVTAGLA